MAVDFAIICSLVRPGRPRYPVLVHRAATLLHASSGRRLAMTPLRFANPSPPSGWIEDFHLQAVDHARHTEKSPAEAGLRCPMKVGLPGRREPPEKPRQARLINERRRYWFLCRIADRAGAKPI